MPTKKRTTPTDADLVSRELHEMKTIHNQFKSIKTKEKIGIPVLYFLHSILHENLGRVTRADFYTFMGIGGYAKNVK